MIDAVIYQDDDGRFWRREWVDDGIVETEICGSCFHELGEGPHCVSCDMRREGHI